MHLKRICSRADLPQQQRRTCCQALVTWDVHHLKFKCPQILPRARPEARWANLLGLLCRSLARHRNRAESSPFKRIYAPERMLPSGVLRRAKSQAAYLRFGDKVAGNVLLDFSPVAPHELPEGLQCLQVEPGLFPFFGTCSKACCFERCHGMPGTSHCQEPFRSQVPPIDAVLDFIRLCSSLC